MYLEDVITYAKMIEPLKAQEMLDLMAIGDFSKNMKNKDRKNTRRKLEKVSQRYDKIKTKSVDDLESIMKGLMGG